MNARQKDQLLRAIKKTQRLAAFLSDLIIRKTGNSTALGNSQFRNRDAAYLCNRGYNCYFHRKFCRIAFECEGLQCMFF